MLAACNSRKLDSIKIISYVKLIICSYDYANDIFFYYESLPNFRYLFINIFFRAIASCVSVSL